MKSALRLLVVLAGALLAIPVIQAEEKNAKPAAQPVAAWPPKGYTKVVGYRFKLPSELKGQSEEEFFTLIRDGAVDMEQLQKLTVKSAPLTEAQTKKLLEATFSTKWMGAANCYAPHHIFLFYDKEDKVTHAIELCFSCTGVHALPDLTKAQWQQHDFRALALLCDELGVWLQGNTVKEMFRVWNAREEWTKDP